MFICQLAFLSKYLLSFPRDFYLKTCHNMQETDITFKSYVKKNFKYIPKHVSLLKIVDPKYKQIKAI